MNTFSNAIYDGQSLQDMAGGALNTVLGSLTGTQLTQGLTIYQKITADLGGLTGALATLQGLAGVAGNNIGPVLNQV